jgi:acyl-CoA reductase-like NAD-dependent aldehyde dehydrogenase
VERVYVDAKVYDEFVARVTQRLAAAAGDERPAATLRAGAGREAEILRNVAVARITSFAQEAEALRMANDSPLGLSASVWSRDRAGAINIARRVEAGSVAVNDHMADVWIPELPLGGLTRSGIGRRMGPEGIRRYCDQQTIVVDRAFLSGWAPSHDRRARLFARLLDLVFRSGLRARLGR